MQNEQLNISDSIHGEAVRAGVAGEAMTLKGKYVVECRDSEGNLKWTDEIANLVTTVGKNHALDTELAGSAYTAAWYVGLIGAASYTTGAAVGDTAASHGGWVEDQTYSNGTRPAATFAAASGGSKATSAASVFNMNGTVTIKGCFLITVATKGGTTGTLFSAGTFSGGDKVLGNGDVLNVSYSLAA